MRLEGVAIDHVDRPRKQSGDIALQSGIRKGVKVGIGSKLDENIEVA